MFFFITLIFLVTATCRTPTTRNDTFDFKPMTASQFNYLEISSDGFEMRTDPSKARIDFWASLLTKYSYAWQPHSDPFRLVDFRTLVIIVACVVGLVVLVLVLNNFVRIAAYAIKLQDLLTI